MSDKIPHKHKLVIDKIIAFLYNSFRKFNHENKRI